MAHFVGLDVSVKETSVCVVDDAGKVILEQKVPTEPADIIALLSSLGVTFGGIGIEAGPLSQWLVSALTAVELPVICVEARHMKALLKAQQINKTDRNDARGIALDPGRDREGDLPPVPRRGRRRRARSFRLKWRMLRD
jgi:transposase